MSEAQRLPRTSLRLLLVEDQPINQRVVARLLEKRGHAVALASTGRKALEALAQERFDAVLMAVQLPEMGGFEALRQLRAGERPGKHLPVIALTAHALKGDRERCLEAGFDGHLAKPIHSEELYAVLEGVRSQGAGVRCQEAGVRSQEAGKAGPCSLTPDSCSLTPAPEVFDRAAALARINGDEEFLRELAQVFLETYPSVLKQIEEALAGGDAERLAKAAHTLKGSVSHLSAKPVFDQARRLELLGRGSDLAEASAALLDLQTEIQRLHQTLAKVTAGG
jgi:CheY-like chemotaxis protein